MPTNVPPRRTHFIAPNPMEPAQLRLVFRIHHAHQDQSLRFDPVWDLQREAVEFCFFGCHLGFFN